MGFIIAVFCFWHLFKGWFLIYHDDETESDYRTLAASFYIVAIVGVAYLGHLHGYLIFKE